jgi:hypothetical protein
MVQLQGLTANRFFVGNRPYRLLDLLTSTPSGSIISRFILTTRWAMVFGTVHSYGVWKGAATLEQSGTVNALVATAQTHAYA